MGGLRAKAFNAKGGHPFRLSFSIGVASLETRESVTLQRLMDRADAGCMQSIEGSTRPDTIAAAPGRSHD